MLSKEWERAARGNKNNEVPWVAVKELIGCVRHRVYERIDGNTTSY